MEIVYLIFENENIRIPFYDHDKGLFTQLINSRLGHWVYPERQYHIPRSRYDKDRLAVIFSDKPFVEVHKEENNPVIINGFFSNDKPANEKIEPFSADNPLQETCLITNTPLSAESLTEQFSSHWYEKLETELRSRKYSPNTRAAYINHNRSLCQWLQKSPVICN